MKTRIPVVDVRGEKRDVRTYNIDADDIGKYAVIQWGYNALSIEADAESAIATAKNACAGDELDIVEHVSADGDVTVDEILEGWIDEDGDISDNGQPSVADVLTMADTTIGKLMIACHHCNYTKLSVHINDDGIIDNATVEEDISRESFSSDPAWRVVYICGTGSVPCNCDACLDGDDPEDWAGDGDGADEMFDEIRRGIEETLS